MNDTIRRVLVIDDDPEMQLVLAMVLKKGGYEPLKALSGREGLAMLRREKPDLVLLDLLMPDLDGWQVVQEKNRDPALAPIPVIILTASGQVIDRTMAEHVARAVAFVTKPFEPGDLLTEIARALAAPAGQPSAT